MLIDETDLLTRTKNALRNGGFITMDEVIVTPHWELSKCRELGERSLRDIERWANENGKVAGQQRYLLTRQLAEAEKRHALLTRDIENLRKRLEP